MPYVNQEFIAKLSPRVMGVCKQYGILATLSTQHRQSITLAVKQGPINFVEEYKNNVPREQWLWNHAWRDNRTPYVEGYFRANSSKLFTGRAQEFLNEVLRELNRNNPSVFDANGKYCNDNGQWRADIEIGTTIQAYILTA